MDKNNENKKKNNYKIITGVIVCAILIAVTIVISYFLLSDKTKTEDNANIRTCHRISAKDSIL